MSIDTVAIVGAGHAAAATARTLRRRGFDGTVTLLGDEIRDPYQRPPLSKEFLTGELDDTSLPLLTRKWVEDNDVTVRNGARVSSIDTASRTLIVEGGASLSADAVVIATGARPRELPMLPKGTPRVHYLRTVDDAARLRDGLATSTRVALIGGGFIGLEIAAAARARGVEVTVVECEQQVLRARLGTRIAGMCADLHRENGVDLRCGVHLAAAEVDEHRARLRLSDGRVLDVDEVVVGIGIEPSVELAAAAGVRVDNGIVVDEMARTSVPGIHAVGDVASRYSVTAGRHLRMEHVDAANRQGAVVARTIMGEPRPDTSAPWFWSDQYEHNLQFTGNHVGAGELVFRGDVAERAFSAFYLREGVVTAAFAIDRGEDIMAARELLGRSFSPTALADESCDLWELVEEGIVA
ncbi:pyridine nucleotide-disulfide oxidoreductase [Rhodococcus rhodnii]|uniref:Reductase n=2 Tax=Rhodococcus rhodnii TaxID=38312 RepID=R7WJ44_9NOCA|nr:FAD-dependent oxidoreductase [Rhodococcus rhodnii]EOM75280.1 reductase [Rhodococcus rhodnii LMG 5362]TXG92088.1 pyridine nucleotide-disulfide oxidoreductase [Rhodococcus rhodnii]